MKKYLFFILLVCSGQLVSAQNAERTFRSFSEINGDYQIHVNDGTYRFIYYTPDIVETTFIPAGESADNVSHAVVLGPGKVSVLHAETEEAIALQTEGISIHIEKNPFQIFYYRGNELLISEKTGYKRDSLETIQFNLTAQETLYGGGARALGMNRRGNRLRLYNQAHYGYGDRSELLNYTVPVVLSSNKYLIHFDNPTTGYLDLDSKEDNTLTYGAISGPQKYQVVSGDSWMELVDNYTELTGKQPLLPRWALGNFSSRFGYHSSEEVLETVAAFRQRQIPVDAIILDLYWFGKEIKGNLGNLAFHTNSFPDPQGMINELKDQNVETILITEPFMQTTSHRWEEAVEADILAKDSLGNPYTYDFYFGNTALIDVFSKKGFNWFKNIYKDLLDMGVTGMWGDLGEPEMHPSDLIHATGTADEVHNIYGHQWAKLVYDAFREYDDNLRPFILMRAGYSGSQRYGIIPWSGDVSRSWGGLKSQLEISLQMGMQGVAWMHSDLGGFAGAILDDELYARWLQYGVFQPIYRPHAQEEVPSEPVFRSDSAKALARKAIELRYRLLPYNYNLMYQNHLEGKPLMRPLFFEEPENYRLYGYSEAYLWGEDFLVAPVVQPGVSEKDVYFPATSDWIDFYTGQKYRGGQTYTVQLSDSTIPAFVRAGAFIPMTGIMQHTKDYTGDTLSLHYYYDPAVPETRSEFYNDNGATVKAFEKGAFERMEFSAAREEENLQIQFSAVRGEQYPAGTKSVSLKIYNIEEEPDQLTVGGKNVPVNWDGNTGILTIPVTWNTENDLKIVVSTF